MMFGHWHTQLGNSVLVEKIYVPVSYSWHCDGDHVPSRHSYDISNIPLSETEIFLFILILA